MRRYIPYLFVLFLFLPVALTAQDAVRVWTLQECLDYALENNIQVRKAKINQLSGEEDLQLAKAQLFPSLSGSVSQGFVNYPSGNNDRNNSYTGNYSVNANWTLFDGARRRTTIRQQEIQNEVNWLNIEENEDDIQVSIVQVYMQILYAMEAVTITRSNVELSEYQLYRAERLLEAGDISRVDVAQLRSQLSSDNYQLIAAQTSLENYKLQLKQLLELDIEDDIAVVMPELTEEDILAPLPAKEVIYSTALAVMPSIKSSELNVDIAELDVKKAKAGYLPSVSLNAGIGTGHLSGSDYVFGSQLWNSFNESIGLTVSIPIFSNRENKTAVNKAKLAVTDRQLDLLNSQKLLLQTVEGIYLDAVSAQSQYLAAEDQVRATQESAELTERQFYLGLKNTLELLTERNNLLTARQQELQSKYMAVMSIQLLNIYQHRPVDITY
ncbi:MAG: TolC family protein [Tannerellaceae bacterium]|nr:TolC family protein [Tannerellaceae bacterium]